MDSEEIKDSQVQKERKSQADVLLKIVKDLKLFHNANEECFCVVPVGSHYENLKIDSKTFRAWLSQKFWESEGHSPHGQAVHEVIETLRGRAIFGSPRIETYIRVAEFEGVIYVDLGNDEWQAVRITSEDWEIVEAEEVPVKFRRTRGMLPLPVPERGGTLDELVSFVNVAVFDIVLVLAWLVNCFRPNKPFPVMVLHGEHGSAKSTTSEVLRSLVDPNKSPLRAMPRSERDLAISANNSWLIAFDNLSGISGNSSDALSRLSTGGGLATRELYSDADEIIFDAKRPILSNGINELATRPDLSDRSVQINCPIIPESMRRTRADFDREFEAARPRIFGALLDKLAEALRELPNVKLDRLPRMADFALFGTAAFGSEFIGRYQELRGEANKLALEASMVGTLVLRLMEGRQKWEGTASELMDELEKFGDHRIHDSKYFPKEPNNLSRELKRIAPNLRAEGIDVTRGEGAQRRNFILEKTSKTSSLASYSHDDDDDANDDKTHNFSNDEAADSDEWG